MKEADKLKPHPASEIFPLMDDTRYRELVEDIRRNGLRVDIETMGGQILDGRNRYRACVELGIEPRFREVTIPDPFGYVWSLNAERRDLDPAQRAAIRHEAHRRSEEWLKKQKKTKAKANKKRSKAAKEQPREKDDTGKTRFGESGRLSRDKRPENKEAHAHVDLAKQAGVSEITAARVISLANKRPDLSKKVADGELSLPAAVKQAKGDVETTKKKRAPKKEAPIADAENQDEFMRGLVQRLDQFIEVTAGEWAWEPGPLLAVLHGWEERIEHEKGGGSRNQSSALMALSEDLHRHIRNWEWDSGILIHTLTHWTTRAQSTLSERRNSK